MRTSIRVFLFAFSSVALSEREIRNIETLDATEVQLRAFPAEGKRLLLGFACDEGSSLSEEKTAQSLAEDGIEVWMPDMLPKQRSSLAQVPAENLTQIMKAAAETGKDVYLIASGPDSELVLRAAESVDAQDGKIKGAVLMFPRLNAGEPVPGQDPQYVAAVGKTSLPLMVLEGERTPNRWGINHLTQALGKGGSQVQSKIIPDVRGYFFKLEDANVSEAVVTSQLGGVIKASL